MPERNQKRSAMLRPRVGAALFAGAALIAVIALTGCGLEDPGTELPESGLKERTATLEDGRKVVCLTWKRGYAGGMSCDWAGAKR